MALDTDRFLDRRRLKRRLTFWRLAAVAAVLATVLGGLYVSGQLFERDRIARIAVDGLILADEHRDDALRKAARDPQVKAVVAVIDSPGGTFVGGEMLYERLRRISAKKPVVAVMRGTATSAAYMVALGADRIFASDGTVTGSIGVILQTANVTGMLNKLGIEPVTVKSGPLKAAPNPLEPFDTAAREATQRVIEDLHAVFVDMVTARRSLTRDQVTPLADGRIFTGRQAQDAGLIDAIGNLDDARDWLAAEHGLAPGLPVIDVEIDYPDRPWSGLAKAVLGKALFSERLTLDGVISLWQPEAY
jgi:protease IV